MAKKAKHQTDAIDDEDDGEPLEGHITIQRLERAHITMYLLGTTALVMNRMAAKAKQQLLYPRKPMNKAEKETVIKHNPVEEFRDSIYKCRDENAPTYVHVPNGALKKALASAALDTPGATKAETGRLVKVVDETVHLYGKPFLYMAPVRMAGISKTPDIRTRAIFPRWALKVTFRYMRQKIREQDIVNLTANAGDITGIGDGRTEKGTFDFGSWEIVNADNKEWNDIVQNEGRKVQLAAMQRADCFDEESEELLAWYKSEFLRREADRKDKSDDDPGKVAKVRTRKKNGDGARLTQ